MRIEEKMSALVKSFNLGLPGENPWDPEKLKKSIGVLSSGERMSAQFLLWVWNHYDNEFDLFTALNRWDDDRLAAFVAWAKAPWWA